MPALLEGKTALILGVANRWSLAYAIAEAFRREGAGVILTYQGERQRETAEALARELAAARVLPCDVTQDDEPDRLAEALRREEKPLDAVVHSIAFANREDLSRPLVDTSRAGYLLSQEVSAYSLVAVARAVAPLMGGGGSITTLSYLGATRVMPNYNVMGVAKAALEACVRYLANDLGPKNIRVNAISRADQDGRGPRHQGLPSGAGLRGRARPAAAQHRSSRSRRGGRLPGQRPRPGGHRKRSVCGRGLPDYGAVGGLTAPAPRSYHDYFDHYPVVLKT